MNFPENLAIVFDLGTTTIAAALLDQATGERLAMTGALNPQWEFGLDVVSRLDAALKSAGTLQRMTALVNGTLQQLARELLLMAGLPAESVKLVAMAGNPAMEHLLLGLPVNSLAFPPYRPLFTSGRRINSAELSWDTAVPAFIFPLPGGFVGGDLVAFLYGCDAGRGTRDAARLFLDLGTNGELALTLGERIFATSAAAGPAFEGGNLACGMAALPGAISGLRLEGERVALTTMGGGVPFGICGSGVMKTVAELLRTGLLDHTGRLRAPAEITSNLANRIIEMNGEAAFVLYRDAKRIIYLGQQDIRQVQLAKAAIRAGIEVLFERSGIRCEDVQEVILTGSFGATLEPGSLKNIGILPEKMVEICRFIREGALAGVEKGICAPRGMEAIDRLAEAIRVVPLSGTPAFAKHFLEQMNFPTIL
ncbi:MAG TPA: ASKHA domain-containing protein [Geobacteraceae bacterium]|nr:ASKHA domain-containing protein [Geobacteraceae bacterium]